MAIFLSGKRDHKLPVWQFNLSAGRLKRPPTTLSLVSSGDLQDLTYQWNTLGNLTSRSELSGSKNLSETFNYDGLNRLTSHQVAGQPEITDTYDSLGNITTKSDVGNYSYGNNAGLTPSPAPGM